MLVLIKAHNEPPMKIMVHPSSTSQELDTIIRRKFELPTDAEYRLTTPDGDYLTLDCLKHENLPQGENQKPLAYEITFDRTKKHMLAFGPHDVLLEGQPVIPPTHHRIPHTFFNPLKQTERLPTNITTMHVDMPLEVQVRRIFGTYFELELRVHASFGLASSIGTWDRDPLSHAWFFNEFRLRIGQPNAVLRPYKRSPSNDMDDQNEFSCSYNPFMYYQKEEFTLEVKPAYTKAKKNKAKIVTIAEQALENGEEKVKQKVEKGKGKNKEESEEKGKQKNEKGKDKNNKKPEKEDQEPEMHYVSNTSMHGPCVEWRYELNPNTIKDPISYKNIPKKSMSILEKTFVQSFIFEGTPEVENYHFEFFLSGEVIAMFSAEASMTPVHQIHHNRDSPITNFGRRRIGAAQKNSFFVDVNTKSMTVTAQKVVRADASVMSPKDTVPPPPPLYDSFIPPPPVPFNDMIRNEDELNVPQNSPSVPSGSSSSHNGHNNDEDKDKDKDEEERKEDKEDVDADVKVEDKKIIEKVKVKETNDKKGNKKSKMVVEKKQMEKVPQDNVNGENDEGNGEDDQVVEKKKKGPLASIKHIMPHSKKSAGSASS